MCNALHCLYKMYVCVKALQYLGSLVNYEIYSTVALLNHSCVFFG